MSWQQDRLMTAVALLLLVSANRPALADETRFSYGGYAKLDIMNTLFRNGRVGPESPARDFHLPSAIPVGDQDETFDHHYHVKESRFHLRTDSDVAGHDFMGYLEMDFLLSKQGDEKVSNSYNPRLRHFYFKTGPWLFGQTWTTFMNIVLPEDLDFSGAAEGIVFGRQPQVRFTHGLWQLSVENSQTTLTTEAGSTRLVSSTGRLPDIVARRDFKSDRVSLGVSVIGRFIHFEDKALRIDAREFGFGASAGAQVSVGKRDGFLLQATAGRGLGRYVALNFVDAVAADSTGTVATINQILGFIGYRHYWTEKLRSSVNVSVFFGDNPNVIAGGNSNKEAQSYSANMLYSPVPKFTLGVEYMHARRVVERGTEGRMDRIQLSARYDFGYEAPY